MAQKTDAYHIYKNIAAAELEGRESFEECIFLNCDLSYANLSNIRFINCVMDTCNLSLIKLTNTGLQQVAFNDCKITGVNFGECNNFALFVGFARCVMDYTVWHKNKIKGTTFTECTLAEADFTETDLTNAVFRQCNLYRTIFNRTLLRGADFSTAYNFTIDPEINTVSKAKFNIHGVPNLLTKYNLVIE